VTDCGCHPGTEENGWHEIRSPECREQEFQEWVRLLRCVRDEDDEEDDA
jgi:hypothetical protein